MNSSQSNLFLIIGSLIALGLIVCLIRLRKRNDDSLIQSDDFENSVSFQISEALPEKDEPIYAVDDELNRLIDIENSLLAVKELYLKRLISAQKYVDETRLIAQQKSKY